MAESKKKTAKKKADVKTKKATAKKTRKVKKKSVKRKKAVAAEKVIDGRKLRKDLEEKAKRVSDRDVEDLIEREQELEKKIRKVPGSFGKLINQLRLLYEMIKDYWKGDYREVPWYSIAMAAAAVLYFINPFDIIPDVIPGIGYLDDALVIGLVFKSIREDLKKYCAFRGYDPGEYF